MTAAAPEQKAAWIYLRSDKPNPPRSNPELLRQRKICYAIAAELEALVSGVYIDAGYPGLDEERPSLGLLLEHLSNPYHHVTHLIVIRSDRLAETEPLALKLKRQIAEYGVKLVTADPPRYSNT
jgi:DNA invertase Pin-like site-specific DNA recombinase